ncbi:hypothetical protein SNA05_04220 [Escherichia coli]|nr:hypothetical protein [Escherichia coli]
MLFLNDKEQIIKYRDEMLKINPQITEMVAKYAGCSVEEVERCVEKYFSPSTPSTPSLNELIKLKAKGRCEQVPDMRSSYSSGAHPRGTS